MMTSPSEDFDGAIEHDVATSVAVRLLNQKQRKRDIVRLEFFPVGQQKAETVESALNTSLVETETRLKEELTALDSELQSQVEQISVQIEIARTEAKLEARAEWESELVERIAAERAAVQQACAQFFRERARYFLDVETEVVKLALAIAERVLHREVKLDPLLLMAVVRIALEKVAADSMTVLRVPANELEMWRDIFALELESHVQLVGDERLGAGECVLDTNVGKVELGVSAQLAEIEKGFFDLLQQRPA